MFALDVHNSSPSNNLSWIKKEFTEPYHSLLNYWLLVDSGRGSVVSCCVSIGEPVSLIDSYKPTIISKALVNAVDHTCRHECEKVIEEWD